jgi:hypothetical protein
MRSYKYCYVLTDLVQTLQSKQDCLSKEPTQFKIKDYLELISMQKFSIVIRQKSICNLPNKKFHLKAASNKHYRSGVKRKNALEKHHQKLQRKRDKDAGKIGQAYVAMKMLKEHEAAADRTCCVLL